MTDLDWLRRLVADDSRVSFNPGVRVTWSSAPDVVWSVLWCTETEAAIRCGATTRRVALETITRLD